MVWLTSGDLVQVNLGGFWSAFEVPVLLLLLCEGYSYRCVSDC